MKASLRTKLDTLHERFEELGVLLGDPDVIAEQGRFRDYSREYAELEPVVLSYRAWQRVDTELHEAEAMRNDADPDIRAMAEEEIGNLEDKLETLNADLQLQLLPRDPDDARNVFLEIRAGTGGDEAALFAGDLFRMYQRYGESKRWKMEIMSSREGEHGGYKEIIVRIAGTDVYGTLKFESGAHRVQRVPQTESQGRIHTSACTVAVMPEIEEIDEIEIDRNDLRIDTYRSSGAGGQHVNKTDSAVRITHLPTGTVVACQDERSQIKNRARAMSLLRSRIYEQRQRAADAARAAERKEQVGSGDRSDRVRTYNFPQDRVTDHRLNRNFALSQVLEGKLEPIVEGLQRDLRERRIAEL